MSDAVRTTAAKPVTPAAAKSCSCGTSGHSGECDDCHGKRETLQRASNGGPGPASVPASVVQTVSSAGRPLDSGARASMESRFGRDFGNVRIHTDHAAADSARAVNARAYTVGQHIAFDRGQYQPRTAAGQHLLAHELAHTVQQRGLQRKPHETTIGDPGINSRYEREAEHAAHAALTTTAGNPTIAAHPTSPVICRAPATAEPPKTDDTEPARVWEPVPATSPLATLHVKEQSKLGPSEITPTIRAFNLGTFDLPPEKGPVEAYWKTRAKGGGLESFIDTDGEPRAALKQERPDTKPLQQIWLTQFGFASPADAATAWAAAGGDKSTTFEPKVDGKTCQMDHIIELQIGGNNIPENLQCLNATENQKSGGIIFARLKAAARKIQEASPTLRTVILHFDDVTQPEPIKGRCYQVDQKVRAAAGAKTDASAEDMEPYPIVAATPTTLVIPKGARTPRRAASIAIEESKYRQNRAASTLIPGMVLRRLDLEAAGKDQIEAGIDNKSGKTALPITIEKETEPIILTVEETTGILKLKSRKANIAFIYPYLSNGAITDVKYDPQAGLSGEGWLRPKPPLLNRLKLIVRFGPDRFEVAAGLDPIDPKKLAMPFGAAVTKAEIGLLLYPEFKPTGVVEFQIAPGGRKVLDGRMTFEADANGLVAIGKVNAHLPGVDKAEGKIEYRAKQWSGLITIESSQIKIPYLKSASVTLTIDNQGPSAAGQIAISLPGGNDIRLEVARQPEGGWVYKGVGDLKVPGLGPVELTFTYVGDKLTATGRPTPITIRGFTGRLTVHYNNGRISGEGTISGKKGRANLQEAKIRYNGETGKFSGSGTLSYQISENLVATAGVDIPEVGPVKVKGALTFPKPIKLFDAFGDRRTIFKTPTIKIPIPGASIGTVGLKVTIDGAILVDYRIGPGQLEDTKIAADFEPFEESKDLKVDLQSRLAIPAHAGIAGSVRGGLALDVLVASVSGGLTLTASVDLDGGVFIAFTAHYEKDRFTAQATPKITAGLVLGLAIDADVMAKAGIGPFSVETKKVWNLKNFRYDTGLQFGMTAPISYDSAATPAFTPPSLDKIQWVLPDLRPGDMLSKIMSGSGTETKAG